jgi:hypothetical protein
MPDITTLTLSAVFSGVIILAFALVMYAAFRMQEGRYRAFSQS